MTLPHRLLSCLLALALLPAPVPAAPAVQPTAGVQMAPEAVVAKDCHESAGAIFAGSGGIRLERPAQPAPRGHESGHSGPEKTGALLAPIHERALASHDGGRRGPAADDHGRVHAHDPSGCCGQDPAGSCDGHCPCPAAGIAAIAVAPQRWPPAASIRRWSSWHPHAHAGPGSAPPHRPPIA